MIDTSTIICWIEMETWSSSSFPRGSCARTQRVASGTQYALIVLKDVIILVWDVEFGIEAGVFALELPKLVVYGEPVRKHLANLG